MAIFMIRSVDQDEEGRRCYWNAKADGKRGAWVPDRIDGSTYTQAQREHKEKTCGMPARGVWERMEVSQEAFSEHLTRCLEQAVKAAPDTYFYGVEAVPRVALKMIDALRNGDASIGPTTKRVAKAMGIKATVGSIQSFLNGGAGDPA